MRRALLVLLLTLAAVLGLAPTATAQQGIPGVDVCPPQAPAPERPGDGVIVGNIDTTPPGRGAPGTVYEQYGYAGLVWHPYDLGCVHNPSVEADTWIGNVLFDATKTLVATYMWLHYTVQGESSWGWLHTLTDRLADLVYTEVYLPWVGVALLIALLALTRKMLRGRVAAMANKGGWVLTGMTVATTSALFSVTLLVVVGGTMWQLVAAAESGFYRGAGTDPVDAAPKVVYREVVWEPWLAGEFGSAQAPQAEEYGRRLLAAQACSKREVRTGSCGDTVEQQQTIGEDALDAAADFFTGNWEPDDGDTLLVKQRQFRELVTEENMGPAYRYVTGKAKARAGAGAWALAKGLAFVLFPTAAILVAVVAFILTAFLIIVGAVIGLIGIVRNTILVDAFRAAGTVILAALLMAVLAGVHISALLFIVNELALPDVVTLLFMGVLTYLMFRVGRPLKRTKGMINTVGRVFDGTPIRDKDTDKVGSLKRPLGGWRDSDRWWHHRERQTPTSGQPTGPRPETVREDTYPSRSGKHSNLRRYAETAAGAAAGTAGGTAGTAAAQAVARRRGTQPAPGQETQRGGTIWAAAWRDQSSLTRGDGDGHHERQSLPGRSWIGPGQQPQQRGIDGGQPPQTPSAPRDGHQHRPEPSEDIEVFDLKEGPQTPARSHMDRDTRIYDVTSGQIIDGRSDSDEAGR